jgi:DedD protein
MARAISDEELQLKRRARRRLIGAIVLVAIIIVVLPMVLDSEPKPVSREITVQIPSPDAGTFTSKVAPLPASKDARAAPKAPESKAGTKPVEEPKTAAVTAVPPAPANEPVKEASKPAPAAKPVKAAPAKPAAKAAKPAAKPAAGQFVVQVIALADAEKAKQMQAQIAAAGIKAYTEIVKTAKGDVTRVRAGPFATREAAEKARAQLKAIGMNGNVTTR